VNDKELEGFAQYLASQAQCLFPLEKLTVSQLVKKSPVPLVMEPEVKL
jgi:hypothetical protein